jgi:hypothetical protein
MFIDLGKKILWTSDPGYGSPNDIIHLRYFKEIIEASITDDDGIIMDR